MVKKLYLFIFSNFLLILNLNASNKIFPNYVDIEKFSGTWFEIARTYNSFQKDCKDSYVEYALKEEKYEIKNICTSVIDNKVINYKGVGKSANEDKNNFSKIKMTYFYIFSKDYNVVFNDNYNIAVISDEDYENVWIMSRNKNLEESKLNEILLFLEKYVDKEKLIFENRGI